MATAAHGQAPTAVAEMVMINFEISRKPRVAAVTCHQQAAVLIATHLVGLSATNFTIINNNIYQHQGGRGVSVARRKNQKHRQMLCSMQLPIKQKIYHTVNRLPSCLHQVIWIIWVELTNGQH